jgi:phosphoribosylformylglycinamidine cyclo-ligase
LSSYRDAGVDQDLADALVPFFAKAAARTRRLEVEGDVGGFAGMLSVGGRLLACSIDGVGTKVELLARAGLHRTAGWDAVAMNVDDVVCTGAEPLLFLDYVSVESLDEIVVTEIVGGVADGCVEAGCALVGGETSQHPGLLASGLYDVVGACVGVVERDRVWGPHRVRAGDAIVGLESSGPHANGFSLIRRLLAPGEQPPRELLAPTAIYARRLLALAESVEVHASAHVTGGGIAGNVRRAVPDGLYAQIDRSALPVPAWTKWIASRGVSNEEMDTTFNMGVGMLVVTPDPDEAVRTLGPDARVVGTVTERR